MSATLAATGPQAPVLLDAGSRAWALSAAALALLPLLLNLPPTLAVGFAVTAPAMAWLAWKQPMPGWLRALLTVDAAEQLRRIRLRNGPAMLARFQEEWIPLEFQYFQAYHKPREDTLRLTSLRRPEDEPPGEESKP